jgi:putative methylase
MGRSTQERLVRKLDLELFLSQIKPYSYPQANLEQYTISESVAATMLYLAAYTYGNVVGKSVLDLGCGTGRIALGACFLGAKQVIGVDIDKTAIKAASENKSKSGLAGANVQWVISDVGAIVGKFDTVLQNPPFGVQTRSADRKFLEKALEVGSSIYSLHSHPCVDKQLIKQLKASGSFLQVGASPFIQKFVESRNGRVQAVYALLMTIPRMFDFHTKAKHDFVVDLYVITRSD